MATTQSREIADASLVAAKVFEAMQWRWRHTLREDGFTPDAEAIAERFSDLVDHVDEHRDGQICTMTGRLAILKDDHAIRLFVEVGTL